MHFNAARIAVKIGEKMANLIIEIIGFFACGSHAYLFRLLKYDYNDDQRAERGE